MLANDCAKFGKQGDLVWLALLYATQFILIKAQCSQPFSIGGMAFVGNIVSTAGERVDHANRCAQPGRKQWGGDRKIFIMRI